MKPRRLTTIGLGLVCMAMTACGYSHQSMFPATVSTVAVPIFENRTFYREMEFSLTEALIKEIERRTPYKVADRGSADTIIEGTIVSVTQRRLSRESVGGLVQELEIRMLVDFEWKSLRTSEVLRQRKGFETVARYVPTAPVGETLDIGRTEAVQRMADDLVSEMRSDW
jgi:hypothetical protein